MADLLLEIEQARSAVINAAAAHRRASASARETALSAAKYSIGRIGTRVAEECIQLHGGIGMTWELPLAHYAKRLVMIDHQLGDEDHHLARYIALGQEASAMTDTCPCSASRRRGACVLAIHTPGKRNAHQPGLYARAAGCAGSRRSAMPPSAPWC